MSLPEEGATHTVERTFTVEDVERFADVSRDRQARHTESDEDGRRLVHGLLTATLPTAIGGELEVLATEMDFAFRRPVYTGERITCEWTTESVDPAGDRHRVTASVVCTNEDDDVVLTAEIEGIVED